MAGSAFRRTLGNRRGRWYPVQSVENCRQFDWSGWHQRRHSGGRGWGRLFRTGTTNNKQNKQPCQAPHTTRTVRALVIHRLFCNIFIYTQKRKIDFNARQNFGRAFHHPSSPRRLAARPVPTPPNGECSQGWAVTLSKFNNIRRIQIFITISINYLELHLLFVLWTASSQTWKQNEQKKCVF